MNLDYDGFKNEELLIKVVASIEDGIKDYKREKDEHRDFETSNYLNYMKGDCINTQLKNKFNDGKIFTRRFKSGPFYNGIFCYSNENKCSFTIMNLKTLNTVKKKRKPAKYLQEILNHMNKELSSTNYQMELFPSFDEDTDEDVFLDIVEGLDFDYDNAYHYIIGYELYHDKIMQIKAILLDSKLGEVASLDLSHYLLGNNANDDALKVYNLNSNVKSPSANLVTLKVKSNARQNDVNDVNQKNSSIKS